MGLILGSVFWLILYKSETVKPWQRKLLAITSHVYIFLADTKHYVSIKLMSKQAIPEMLQSELLTGVTWHVPHKFTAITIQDDNQSI